MKHIFTYHFPTQFDEKDFFALFNSKDAIKKKQDDCIIIDSYPYTNSSDTNNQDEGWRDHYKCFFAYKDVISMKNQRKIYVEIRMSAQQKFHSFAYPKNYCKRIRNIREDPRLCSCGPTLYDEESDMYYGFLFTNECIYVVYGFLRKFMDLIYVGPYKEMQMVDVGFLLQKDKKVVQFFVNKNLVWKLDHPGLRSDEKYRFLEYGGDTNGISLSEEWLLCFGTYSFLDAYLPNNYAREKIKHGYVNASALVQLNKNETYKQPYHNKKGELENIRKENFLIQKEESKEENRLFGQGSILCLSNFHIYAQEDEEKKKKKTKEKEEEDLSYTTDCMDYRPKKTHSSST